MTCLAGAAERRLWTTTANRPVFCNLYTLLVAPPAVGKSEAISQAEYFWHHAKKLKVAPKSVTRASLVDELADAQRRVPVSKEELIEYASLCVGAGELGVLIPSHDLDFLSVLNHIYDNPPQHSEKRRTNKINHQIVQPTLTVLAGTQPAYLANLLPEEAWGMGFMSRQIMVYSGTPVMVDLFPEIFGEGDPKIKALRVSLISDTNSVTEMYGPMAWEEDAAKELQRWFKEGLPPKPEHSKLEHYSGRRILHIIKLSMIASISRGNDRKISLPDLTRAKDWLLEAESVMPDIFREMVGRSDAQVIADLHFFTYSIWVKENKNPLHESRLIHFLQTKVSADRIDRVLSIAERANIIARIAGTGPATGGARYIPRPKNEHGLE